MSKPHAHPMIQPSDWATSPELADTTFPEKVRAIYRLIWDSAIATQLRPPILSLTRTFYEIPIKEGSPFYLAIDQVKPIGDMKGFWRYRRDLPDDRDRAPPGWQPSLVNVIDSDPQDVLIADALLATPSGGLSLSDLILALEQDGVTTASSLPGILKELFDPTNGGNALLGHEACELTIREESGRKSFTNTRYGAPIQITAEGRAALQRWRTLNLPKAISIDQWDMSPIAGWRDLGIETARAERIETWIEDALSTTTDQAVQEDPSATNLYLPADLDPEKLLPLNHPLRKLRREMEHSLRRSTPDWDGLVDKDRSALRLAYLERLAESLPVPLTGEMADFNPVTRWLLGRAIRAA